MRIKNLFRSGLLLFAMLWMVACSSDEDDTTQPAAETHDTSVEVTDAPIDNANVSGAFVTITNVKINGRALANFQPTTVNLLSLQNGTTQALGNVALESGTTSSIVVEFSNEVDDQGQAIGNYILLEGGEKVALAIESAEIVVNDAAEVVADAENTIVLDFDLRKMITADDTGNFQFVSGSELQSSVRAVNKIQAGKIEGTVDDSNNPVDNIVVYAYEKGTYTEAETSENASGVRFSGAVTSSLVSEADGSYSLNFLEEGDYELHYAAYSENTAGEMTFQGEVQVNSATGLNLDILGLSVGAGLSVTANVVVTGVVQ